MYCRLCKQLAFACRSWERKRAVSISEWDAMSILDYNPFSILSLSPPPPPLQFFQHFFSFPSNRPKTYTTSWCRAIRWNTLE